MCSLGQRQTLHAPRLREGHEPTVTLNPVERKTVANYLLRKNPRVNVFLNRFRKNGFIDYNGGLEVHQSLREALPGS
jgi:hypothetical protein